ncbi:MAG: SMP-30/gluconolactonase/LRE family protein [Bacteroidota bacterium]
MNTRFSFSTCGKHICMSVAIGLLLLTTASFAQQSVPPNSKLIAKGAKLKLLSADFVFTEGPAADADGNVYFTDQPNNRIMKWEADGDISVYMEDAGRSNGLYIDHEGNLLACADLHNQLWKISPQKEVSILLKDWNGKRFNGPNDLWIDPEGGIYFTDPFYKRKYWDHEEKEIEQERVYYLSPDRELTVVADDLVRPNGIIGSPDGQYLFVADINDGKTYKYQIQADGSLTNKTLHVNMGSDGMTLDSKGNLYLTGKGVTVVNPKGEKIAHIPVDQGWTANVCFGGKKRKTLFITAMNSVYTLDMKVKGTK